MLFFGFFGADEGAGSWCFQKVLETRRRVSE